MGISEDVEDLKLRIRKTVDANEKGKLSDLLAQAFELCEKIKVILADADEKEKKELNNVMKGFKEFLSKEMGRLSKKMGLSEDELARFNENPENFSKEQWMVMKAVKKRFMTQTKEIKKVIRANPSISKKRGPLLPKPKVPSDLTEQGSDTSKIVKVSSSATPPEKVKKKKNKRKVGLRKIKKDKWLKS